MEKTLKKLYYSTDSNVCFTNSTALLKAAKKLNKKITLKLVESFLSKQKTYTLHKQRRHRFKRNQIRTAGLDVDWQCDLADMN